MIKNEELRERIDQFCEDLFIPKIPYGSIADINARTALTPIVGTEKEFRGKLAAFAESLILAPPESPHVAPGINGVDWRSWYVKIETFLLDWRKVIGKPAKTPTHAIDHLVVINAHYRMKEKELPPESAGPLVARCPECGGDNLNLSIKTDHPASCGIYCVPAAQGPSAEEIVEMQLALRAADAMAIEIAATATNALATLTTETLEPRKETP